MSLFWPDPQKDLQALIELHEELVQLRREAERLTNAPGVKVYRVRDYGAIREAGRAIRRAVLELERAADLVYEVSYELQEGMRSAGMQAHEKKETNNG